ncbi:hypothetical protein [Aquamicrobium sp.]|uniref:hypothetical protein n=1 Tax=Aquamicrobium sp. TaxID=1872579 RepID=UPI002589487D|nr:hypothetical protein [Aquamicrobium sp.]MCK9549282.1 hypothetical protein [Aquamicrobium sp.]
MNKKLAASALCFSMLYASSEVEDLQKAVVILIKRVNELESTTKTLQAAAYANEKNKHLEHKTTKLTQQSTPVQTSATQNVAGTPAQAPTHTAAQSTEQKVQAPGQTPTASPLKGTQQPAQAPSETIQAAMPVIIVPAPTYYENRSEKIDYENITYPNMNFSLKKSYYSPQSRALYKNKNMDGLADRVYEANTVVKFKEIDKHGWCKLKEGYIPCYKFREYK